MYIDFGETGCAAYWGEYGRSLMGYADILGMYVDLATGSIVKLPVSKADGRLIELLRIFDSETRAKRTLVRE